MMNIKGIFAVSLIAMVAVVAGTHTSNAVAAIASQGYVDEQVGLKANATDLEAKVDIYQGGSAANKAVITNASGNITTGTISSAMITDGTITNADIAANAAIETSKVYGLAKVATSGSYNDLDDTPTIPTVNNATLTIQKNGDTVDTFTANASANKTINITVPTATSQLTNDSDFITAEQLPDGYTLPVATESALGGVKSGGDITVDTSGAVTVNSATKATQDASGNVITSTYATKADVGSKLSSISGETTGTGNVVTNVLASGSAVSATKGITAEETKNKVKSVRAASSATDTAYPSEKAVATALAGKVDTSALSGYATIKALDAVENKALAAQTAADAAASAAATAQNAANAKVATAQGTDAANKAVITNSSGTITTGQIASGMIADDAVTSAKLAAGAVDATALASDAVTSAKIADGTITNADIASNAQIAASKVDFSGLSGSTTGGGNVVTNVTQTNGKVSAFKGITAEVASNRVTSTEFDSNTSNDTKYPTVKAVADAIAASAPTASDILTTTTVTSSGTGAVLTGVSVEAGKVTLQKGNVQIPSGGQNATSYVSIWVE